ncbi:MAG: hypothetical protein A2Z72_08925 [Omnitrophica bacterium RBG_13_46_9]|nr:MAG: hypothetical protein A2Z72_08925 [Omnitrophica bacterium RBG_13_46_9]
MSIDDIGSVFHKYHNAYLASVHGANSELYRNIGKVINPLLKGDVLDIGNGGCFAYDVTKASKIVAIDTCFKTGLNLEKIANVSYQYDDILIPKTLHPDSFDTVLTQSLFHHVSGKSHRETLKNARKVIENARYVLRPGGMFVIIEPITSAAFESIERTLFKIFLTCFSVFRIPMIYLFSFKTIMDLLKDVGFVDVGYGEIKCPKKIDLCTTILPNLIVIPGWLAHFRYHFFIAKL